ncbi:BBE domain-containing protein [Nocardia rhizosphaerihabitans]|uniref:Berberine/berberine-like domain-containing protein n=1 Tax=Nocardia rhizosphaerihabitans TaxID=1691570 RepID=A0ABQ2KSS2_9NOCA|nr:BBE domain-containing protein [Nocardia rhizosphaerihabitans]GGN91510.1 hypothetical protein GCM10011610_51780 [Nocardia rhizosphaerihabitans]
MPYPALQQLFDGIAPWGMRAYEKSLYLDRIDVAAAEVMVRHYPRRTSPLSVMPTMPLCGRFSALTDDDTAFGGSRAPGVVVNISGACPETAGFAAEREWVRDFWTELRPFARAEQGYVNFMSDTGQEQVAQTYGAEYGRLRAIKAAWDPANVFRHNANIPPGVS